MAHQFRDVLHLFVRLPGCRVCYLCDFHLYVFSTVRHRIDSSVETGKKKIKKQHNIV